MSESFCSEIESLEQSKDFQLPNSLYYDITLTKGKGKKRKDNDDNKDDEDEHGVGDLIAITIVRPKSSGDLERPGRPYLIAYVHRMNEVERNEEPPKLSIQSSKPVFIEDGMENSEKSEALYAVKLINLTTNLRIWSALHSNPKTANRNIIQKVLKPPFMVRENSLDRFHHSTSKDLPSLSNYYCLQDFFFLYFW